MSPAVFGPGDVEAVVAGLAMLARSAPVPAPEGSSSTTWHDLLFEGPRLRDPGRPDQAVLAAFADLVAGLEAHLETVPARLHEQWLREVLGIPQRPAVPDVVPLGFTRVSDHVGVVVPGGSELRAKDTAGKDRRYVTTEPLTVHGVSILDVHAYRARRDGSGMVADTVASWTDRTGAFGPFAVEPGALGSPRSPHRCRFADPVLALSASGAQTRITVSFTDTDARMLQGARWFQSTAGGPVEVVGIGPGTQPGSEITLAITQACEPDPTSGETLPWLEMRLPPEPRTLDPTALSASFTDVGLSVRVTGLPADAAYANDGKLDLEKQAQPFGPVPQRGDAFYIRSQEAFGKPLARLGVDLGLVPAGAAGPGRLHGREGRWDVLEAFELGRRTGKGYFGWAGGPDDDGLADVTWQYRSAGVWQDITSTHGALAALSELGVTTSQPADGFSEESAQGGKSGRAIRAVLIGGDLGWADHQTRLAQFAADAVNRATVSARDLLPPEPPSISRARITYQTASVRPTRVTSTDGWAWRTWSRVAGQPYAPFRVPVALGGGTDPADAATLDLGLNLPDTAIGSTVSLYLDVASADVGAAEGTSEWQMETPAGWRAATVSDGTHGLRQSGLLHIVASQDWVRGSAAAGDPDGTARWLRLSSTEPGRLGALLAVLPDAVEAAQLPRPDLVAPGEALLPGQVKGLISTVPGIKNVVNLAGRRGRDAEPTDEYLRSGSGYHRHRDRAAEAWDYEELARLAVPDLAATRCLPHTCPNGGLRPGDVALVVVPAGNEPMPVPTVAMAERIESALRPRMPLTAALHVLAPAYRPVSVSAHLVLARGVPALVGRQRVLDLLEAWLHPTRTQPLRFGRTLFASEVVAFLESLDVVDRVASFALADADGVVSDPVEVDPDYGLVASSGAHALTVEEGQ